MSRLKRIINRTCSLIQKALKLISSQKTGSLTLTVSFFATLIAGALLFTTIPLNSTLADAIKQPGSLKIENENQEEKNEITAEPSSPRVVKRIKMIITGYSSTPDQTDNTPFITASGKMVQDGIVANNLLSFGTKIKIPELYPDKIFVVEDRMNRRKGCYHVDIWFPTREEAKNFGVKIAEVEVLEE